jgi:hypothetical protein
MHGESARRKSAANTQRNTSREHRLPCLGWDTQTSMSRVRFKRRVSPSVWVGEDSSRRRLHVRWDWIIPSIQFDSFKNIIIIIIQFLYIYVIIVINNVFYDVRRLEERLFWDVTPCGSCKNRHFGGTLGLHHQGTKNYRARNNFSSN